MRACSTLCVKSYRVQEAWRNLTQPLPGHATHERLQRSEGCAGAPQARVGSLRLTVRGFEISRRNMNIEAKWQDRHQDRWQAVPSLQQLHAHNTLGACELAPQIMHCKFMQSKIKPYWQNEAGFLCAS